MTEIKPNEVYTTTEAQALLKISKSTIKRFLKNGIIRAHKLGGSYRILGAELLRAISPDVERKVWRAYHDLKVNTKKRIKNW